MHSAARHFHLALTLRLFDVGRECNVYLSECGRYTSSRGIPPMQNTQIDRTEVARCTLLVSCSTDLDYCVVSVYRVGVFFEHVHIELEKLISGLRQTSLSFLFIWLAFLPS